MSDFIWNFNVGICNTQYAYKDKDYVYLKTLHTYFLSFFRAVIRLNRMVKNFVEDIHAHWFKLALKYLSV